MRMHDICSKCSQKTFSATIAIPVMVTLPAPQNQPLVSVIIPTYNEAPTLGVAIQSMLDQTYRNLEILVVDDGSTDNTEEVVRNYIKKDHRVHYLKCPYDDPHRVDWRGVNISVGYLARNYAMEQVHGEWITFQDADDASLLNRIEVQYNLAVKHNATCITTSWLPFSEDLIGKHLDTERILKEEEDIIISPDEITQTARRAKGPLMTLWFPHTHIPFLLKKWVPGARKLFFGNQEKYPGADNSMFFKREVTEQVKFRKFDDRMWPALSGRGVGRDFVFQIAETFKNSYSFRLPLYLWRVKDAHNPYPGWEKYLLS